jgi:autotransporter-associated beta strand protein
VTFTNGLTSSSGTLTKIGAGTLILAGANTYSGNTTVSVGKLAIQGTKTGSGNISVADSAALVVTAGGTQITPSSLTLGTSAGATLEFNNLSSTTTAPISASTLAAAGTVTINVNSGTFTPGQSYPLLTWTTGPAPTFSLGVLNGFAGNLSITANTLRLNITGTAYRWTGANNGTWDTTTANNWIQNGAPAVFANGGPVLFDDTSTRISVTVGGVVQPTSVTVDVNTNAYTITSSSGNNIGGSANLNKSSSSTLTLAGGANAYTGVTTISGGILSVGTLANGGTASDIGGASSSAASLLLNGGALLYTGAGASVDRLFTLGTSSGTLDSSGSGALNLNNSGSLGYLGTGPRGLTLTGTDANNNTLAASFADNGGATTLTKNGAGKWILSGSNTYSGVTTIAAGILQVGAGGAGGSLGSGNVVDNGALVFNRTGTLIVSGIVSGTGSVTNDGTGTVILANNNTYSGGTTINAGTLQIGNGGATGGLDTGDPVANNGTLIFNSTGALTLNGGINGTGNLIKRGSGLLKLIGNNTFTGNTTIDAGAQLQIAQGNTGTYNGTGTITNNGTLIFVRQDNAVLYITNNIVGTGAVVKDSNNPNNGDVTLVGTNTYAGNTRINGGFLILGDGVTPGAGSIVGNVAMTNFSVAAGNPSASSFRFNRPDDFTFSGNITGAGSLEQNGFNTVTLTGTNTYTAGTTIGAGTLQAGNGGTSGSIGTGNVANGGTLIFNRSDAISFGGVISSVGSVVKAGAGTLTLTASNTYTGFTVVSNGTLLVNGADSAVSTTVYGGTLGGTGTFFGPITLDPGTTLAPGGTNNSVGTLTINGDLSIGGNVAIDVNRSLAQSNDLVVVSGVLTNAGNGTLTVANLGPTLAVGNKFTLFSQPLLRGASLTITGGGATWNNNLAVDGSITVATVLVVTPPTLTFTKPNSTNLQFSWTGNFKLQSQTNTLAVGLSTNWVDHPNGGTSPVTVPIGTTNGAVNFRLISQ